MASPLPLVCHPAGPEPIRIGSAPRRRPASRRPVAMLMRSLAVIAGLALPVAAAALADLAHSGSPAATLR